MRRQVLCQEDPCGCVNAWRGDGSVFEGPCREGAAPQEKQCWDTFGSCAKGSHPWGWSQHRLVLCLEGVSPPALLFPPSEVPGLWESSHVPLRSAGLAATPQHRGVVVLVRGRRNYTILLPGVPSWALYPTYHTWHQGTNTLIWEIRKDGRELHESWGMAFMRSLWVHG